MADGTHIEWTDATWNPITGCSIVSPGCTNCYAMKLAGTRLKHTPSRQGLTIDTKGGPVWNGEVRLNQQWIDQPLRWKRPRRIFVCAHGDLFAENVPDEWIDKVFAVMALSPQHTFQVLTKRATRMREYFDGRRANFGRASGVLHESDCFLNEDEMQDGFDRLDLFDITGKPLPNVWIGVSVEDQARADERIPELLQTPAAVRFISAEPLLGPIDLARIRPAEHSRLFGFPNVDALLGAHYVDGHQPPHPDDHPGQVRLDWVIVGGESGPNARPMHPDWARRLRDQCAAAGVAFFFKQWGEWTPGENADFTPTRSERVATLMSDGDGPVRWSFNSITPRVSAETHRDDAPDVYRIGKKRAGRKLDGIEHSAFPEASK